MVCWLVGAVGRSVGGRLRIMGSSAGGCLVVVICDQVWYAATVTESAAAAAASAANACVTVWHLAAVSVHGGLSEARCVHRRRLRPPIVIIERSSYAVKKYPYIRGYFVASFPHLNGTGSVYTFVSIIDGMVKHCSVCRGNEIMSCIEWNLCDLS